MFRKIFRNFVAIITPKATIKIIKYEKTTTITRDDVAADDSNGS